MDFLHGPPFTNFMLLKPCFYLKFNLAVHNKVLLLCCSAPLDTLPKDFVKEVCLLYQLLRRE